MEDGDIERSSTKIDVEILRQAKTIAALEGKTLGEVLESVLRKPIRRMYEQKTSRATADLGGSD